MPSRPSGADTWAPSGPMNTICPPGLARTSLLYFTSPDVSNCCGPQPLTPTASMTKASPETMGETLHDIYGDLFNRNDWCPAAELIEHVARHFRAVPRIRCLLQERYGRVNVSPPFLVHSSGNMGPAA